MNDQSTYASIQLALIALAGGLIMLTAGGEFLVSGATKLARRWGMTPLLIGLTVVAFGTSMPELFVGLLALFQNHSDLMVGNVVGSNIANIGLILGISAVIVPLPVTYALVQLELYLVLLASLALMGLTLFGTAIRPIGLIFVGGLISYTYFAYRNAAENKKATPENNNCTDGKTPASGDSYLYVSALMTAGFFLLAYGSDLFIAGAVDTAKFLGVNDLIIGLTIAAVGTSLPELASCLAAIRHRQRELLVGNIIGSNLFNILMVLGLGAIAKPYALSSGLLVRDLPIMFTFSAVLVPLFFFRQKLSRLNGLLFLIGYGGYIWLLV
jgi:cation:H+ antiporter